jgi:serine/threonine-protein kinase
MGLVHHDVKPGNVLLGRDGAIKVNDFGLANFLTVLADKPHQLFGTPGYLPPETLLGKGFDQTGDLFGLGVILYQCLTGARPFDAPSVLNVIQRTVEHEPPPPRKINRKIPGRFDKLVMALLAKQPEQRPQSAAEVIDELMTLGADSSHRWQPDLHLFTSPADEEPDESHRSCLVTTLVGKVEWQS